MQTAARATAGEPEQRGPGGGAAGAERWRRRRKGLAAEVRRTRARKGCTRPDHDGTPGRSARNGRTVTTRADRPTAGAEHGGHPPAARTACRRRPPAHPADTLPASMSAAPAALPTPCRRPAARALIFTPTAVRTADAQAAAQRTTQPAAQRAAQQAAQRKPLYMRLCGKGATQRTTQRAAQAAAQQAAHLCNN